MLEHSLTLVSCDTGKLLLSSAQQGTVGETGGELKAGGVSESGCRLCNG